MKRCKVQICRAKCCYNVPLPIGFVEAHVDRIVNPILISLPPMKGREDMPESQVFFTDCDLSRNKCPFLRHDCKCNVYGDRPEICRRFGESDDPLLKCSFRK